MIEGFDIPPRITQLAQLVKGNGGRLLLVGGCVRDFLMQRQPKDYDAEVFGIEQVRLLELLKTFGRVNAVGESFKVYKLGKDLDVSLPRRERKQGRGHKGFIVEGDHTLSFKEAARRRDFTINAVMMDALTGEVIDEFDGQSDLQRKVLRAVDNETFVEDSLRVLRAAQFAARFEFAIEAGTVELCHEIDLSDLPPERVWGEIEKLLLQAARPSIGLRWLDELNATAQVAPEFAALGDEGKARTLEVADNARRLIDDLTFAKQVTVMLAAVCARLDERRTDSLLERWRVFTFDGYDVRRQVTMLVKYQAKPFEFYQANAANGALRRLAAQCELNLLWRIAVACSSNEAERAACAWFISRARELDIEIAPPKRLLQGRHLQELGLQPSPQFGVILKQVYERQLDDEVTSLDEAIAAAKDFNFNSM